MNNTALAIIQPDELDTIQRAARLLAVSAYFDGKGDTPQAIAMMATKIMAGREMGFGPFASVNGIHIISGKPSVGANLMAAAVKGSPRYDYRVKEMSSERCIIEFFEREGEKRVSIGISEFSKEDAQKAGTQNMNKFARNMLFARAMSNGVRWYCPDIFSGNAVYVPEELGADVDENGDVIDVTPRRMEPSTGEIIDTLTTPVTNPVDGDELFDTTPYFVRDFNHLTGAKYDLVKWIAALHKNQCGPCSKEQYGYVVGILDELSDNQHSYILSLLCQNEITKSNVPSKDAASALIKFLAKTVKENGVDVPNPKFRQDFADMIGEIAKASEVVA